MEKDVSNNVISIKQKLKDSLNPTYSTYIESIINKNIKDCNLLYTQVCYFIKLFILYEFEENNSISYEINEKFIIFCFNLIKKVSSIKTDNDILKLKLVTFYKNCNIIFKCPEKVCSISHIITSLATDIATNIKNNTILNFYKYLKEFIKINITINFKDNQKKGDIHIIFNDIVYNTYYSDIKYHEWIKENKNFIVPDFSNNIIQINSIKNDITTTKPLKSYIIKYIKNDKYLHIICLNNDIKNDNELSTTILNDLINIDKLVSEPIFHEWILTNVSLIINKFNSENYIDMDSMLSSTPHIFLEKMLYMNKNLEINKSKKHYQIIPIRTNLKPKFIPITPTDI